MPRPPDSPAPLRIQPLLPLQGVTLLLVEDSRFAAEAVRLLAQHAGARLRRAGDLRSARQHLACYRPDLVLIDMGLPDGSGTALIAELATDGPVPLAISGDPDLRGAALAAGAQGFLAKPLPGPAAFAALILRHLPGRTAPVRPAAGTATPPDPLALREDLLHAAALLGHRTDAAGRAYLAGFLGGLARSTGDAALARAAGVLHGAADDDLPPLCRLVAQRISMMPRPFA